jgi:hypothetical protein
MDMLLTLFDAGLLAQITMPEGFRNIMGILRAFAAVLAVGALIFSGIAFATGRVDSALWGITAAGILGISVALVKVIFDGTGDGLDF